jgi:hypothetical protein
MRLIDRGQFKWLVALSVGASATALFIDESVFYLSESK